MSEAPPVWFIPGSSRGFGWFFTEAALARGDSVVATARSLDRFEPLVKEHGDRILPLELDVTRKNDVDDPEPPRRVLLGVMAFDLAQEACHRRLAEWDKRKVLSPSTEWTED